jgi:hypothetical protein
MRLKTGLTACLLVALALACGKSDDKARKAKAGAKARAEAASAPRPAAQPSATPLPASATVKAVTARSVDSAMNRLDAVRFGVQSVSTAPSLDAAAYPLITRFQDPRQVVKVTSPDGKWQVWRSLDKGGYFLHLSKADGKDERRLEAAKNGYQPSFSPDSRRILYTAMNWATEERGLYVYEIATDKKQRCFTAKPKLPEHDGLGGLAAWSADGSKIIFTYIDDLWMMNANGIGRSLMNLAEPLKKPVTEAAVLAWNKAGDGLVYQARGEATFHIVKLTNRI